ncbi:PREDICTED: GTP-binding protein Rit2 [Wasmannia auropunctata]|uniref:GTP-binding protein Rit2 n=1 Tax=Wasmannia auropunctata TaxID=64793 RepID=UPI0005EE0215|nr:PREDICTED: GTP-binding protein Rit2 [Wasmannia auropunctata]
MHGRPAACTMTAATTAAGISQDRNIPCNGKDDIAVVTQPTVRSGLRVYKIVVLGDGGVGKSAVTLQFVSHRFLDYHDPTIEDSYQTQVVIDGEAALLDILDTAGQVEFTAMREQYMRCGEGFMICYSVTDRHSFQETMEYRKLISRVRANENIPLVLVGNKFDLLHHRKVTTEEGKALAEELGCPFYETSAALRQFIDDAFFSLIRQIRAKERSRSSHRKRSRWWRIRSIFAFIFRRKRHPSHRSP